MASPSVESQPEEFHTTPTDEIENIVVLLAEDNEVNQEVATDMLTLLGCRIEIANNGAEAIEMIDPNKHDIVFMDCEMPEMNGLDATRFIRSHCPNSHNLPIIAMTANAQPTDRARCLDAGMDDFVPKPISLDILKDVLQKWVRSQK